MYSVHVHDRITNFVNSEIYMIMYTTYGMVSLCEYVVKKETKSMTLYMHVTVCVCVCV